MTWRDSWNWGIPLVDDQEDTDRSAAKQGGENVSFRQEGLLSDIMRCETP